MTGPLAHKFKNRQGFTLIELLIAMSVMAVLLTSVSLMLAAIMKGTRRASIVNRVKSEGAYAIQTMVSQLRYARSVECCNDATDCPKKIIYTAVDASMGSFACNPTTIASGSANLTSELLNSCSISCADWRTVNISFNLGNSGSTAESANMNFDAQVMLRNVQ